MQWVGLAGKTTVIVEEEKSKRKSWRGGGEGKKIIMQGIDA
jgi:hypothetical protein